MALCSHCRAEIVPVVAIDIDGTLSDYHGHFLKFAAGYLGVAGPLTYGGSEPFRQWWCREWGQSEATWVDIKTAYRQGAMKRSQPILPNAAWFMQELAKQLQLEVWVTTTRPYLRFDRTDPDTRAWLDRYEIPFHGLLYDDDKYQRLAELVGPERVVAVLDDLPEQYDEAARLFGKATPILRGNFWNWQVERPNKHNSLPYLLSVIERRIHEFIKRT